jgi:hypothetical protein
VRADLGAVGSIDGFSEWVLALPWFLELCLDEDERDELSLLLLEQDDDEDEERGELSWSVLSSVSS